MSILVATDLSTRSAAAVRFAEELSAQLDMPLTVLHAAPETRADVAADAANALSLFLREYLERPEVVESVVAVGETIPTIAHEAAGYDLLVCGATGSSYLDDIFLGSTASRLVREASTPVCVVPDNQPARFESIVIPVGFDESSHTALGVASDIARATGATLCLFHAVGQPDEIGDARAQLEALVDEMRLSDLNISFEVSEAEPAEGIREAVARHGFDMVVMGTHGRGDQSLYFLGSVAERIVRQPPCVVVTTRPR